MPAVLRFQVFSLMRLLLLVVLTLLPFFVGVFAFLLVGFRDDVTLFEESNGWPDPFIEIFLIDFNPMDVPRLFANLDAFENLLLVGFERWQILRGKHIGRAMKTRQFHELAYNFCGFQTGAK